MDENKYNIHMWPDYGQIFWDMNGLGGIGEDTSLTIYAYEDREKEIDLSTIQPELARWLGFWESHDMDVLLERHSLPKVPMSRWKEWWDEGYRLAKKVKELLPDDVDLYYMWKVQKSVWKLPDDGFETNTKRIFLHCNGEPFLVK